MKTAQSRASAAAALVNNAVHTPHGPGIPCPAPHKHPQSSPTLPPVRGAAKPAGRASVRTVATAAGHPQVLAEGTRLGGDRYWLGPVLGRGSFGITYRGLDQRLDRQVAVKEFFPEGSYRDKSTIVPPPSLGRDGYETEREHFIQEARVLAQFQRPGIVRVYEVFAENDTAYMVMEYLAGKTLVEVLRERGTSLPVADALRYVVAVADALAAVHEQQLLHRDVKPGNIMITPADQPVLIDFGAARRYDRYQRTSVMTAIGTPGYAPLEQWGSSGRFGPCSDVYALAATLYHLITGTMPLSAADRAIDDTLEPPHAVNGAVPEPVSEAIMRALAVRMEDRPQTMAAFAAALRSARGTRPRGGGSGPAQPPAAAGWPPAVARDNRGAAVRPQLPAAPASQPPAQVQGFAMPPVASQAPQQPPLAPADGTIVVTAPDARAVGQPASSGRLARRRARRAQRRAMAEAFLNSWLHPASPSVAPSTKTAPAPVAPRTRRLRARWPRRRLGLIAWAGAAPLSLALFATSMVTVSTVVPVLAVLAVAGTGDLRRVARVSLRRSAQFAMFGVSACAISAASLFVVAGLTARGIARTAFNVIGPG